MSGNMTDNIVNDIKNSVQRKIEAGETNGDINQQLLILVTDTHDKMHETLCKVEEIENNWAIRIGKFVKEKTALAIIVAQIVVFLLVVTSMVSAISFIDKLGLIITVKP